MKNTISFVLSVAVLILPLTGQQNQNPPPTKIIVETPFGPKEVVSPGAPPQVIPVAQPAAEPPVTPIPAAAQPAPLPPVQLPTVPSPQGDETVPIALNLDNADIYQVIRIIGDALKLNYVIDPAVKGNVNINTAGNLRRADLLPILETILKINGATMVKSGNFYQIVLANTAMRQPIEVQDRPLAAIAPDDQMVMQIIRMKFVSASEMARLLAPYMSEGANIVAHEAGNILLLTERRSNLKKLVEIMDIFDTNVFEGERVRLFPVKNNLAKDIVIDLKNIFSGYALSETSSAVRFLAIDRINSILVVTPNQVVFPEVERWIGRLDLVREAASSGRHNYVYKVKNSSADDIQKVLGQLYGFQLQVSNVSPTSTPATPASTSPFAPGTTAPQLNLSANAIQAANNVKIIADSTNNALIIQATSTEYQEIEKTIQDLDVLPRQVLIDAQIYEVVLDESISFGLSAILQTRGTLTNPTTTASFVSGSGGGQPSIAAQTFAFIGRTRELVMFLNAQENRSRVRTLSAPSVLVSDNKEAEFTVGADVPVPTSSSVTPVQSGGTNLFAQTIQFRSTGVILKVKAKINEGGNVTLDIAQEVSQAGANTTSAVVAPVIGKSSVTSTIVVQDSQTIALGGFIRENNDVAKSRIPLLGRIPLAGALFGSTGRTNNRTELVILVTPHVLRTHEEADLATDELKSKLREVKKLLK